MAPTTKREAIITEFTIKEDFPKSEIEFDQRFSNINACYEYLAKNKWPGGFICEKCDCNAYWISSRNIYLCFRFVGKNRPQNRVFLGSALMKSSS